MFYYPTIKTLMMTIINAAFASLLFGFFRVAFAPWGYLSSSSPFQSNAFSLTSERHLTHHIQPPHSLPAFTFPFCFATMVVVGIGKSLPDFVRTPPASCEIADLRLVPTSHLHASLSPV
jgi:hypothetical protein